MVWQLPSFGQRLDGKGGDMCPEGQGRADPKSRRPSPPSAASLGSVRPIPWCTLLRAHGQPQAGTVLSSSMKELSW